MYSAPERDGVVGDACGEELATVSAMGADEGL